jgi:hypothetical protein
MKAKSKAIPKTDNKPVIPGPSPNPMTNLILLDLVLKAGTRVARHALERGMLGTKYSPEKAKAIVKSRTMTQTLVGTAVARVATGSVPGALLVGGGLLAKSLYDYRMGLRAARIEGQAAIEEKAKEGAEP